MSREVKLSRLPTRQELISANREARAALLSWAEEEISRLNGIGDYNRRLREMIADIREIDHLRAA